MADDTDSHDLPTRSSWTSEQTAEMHVLRTSFAAFKPPFGSAPTIEQRLSVPCGNLPDGVRLTAVLVPAADDMPLGLVAGAVFPAPVPAFWYTSPGHHHARTAVLWVHGGGNVVGSPVDDEHRAVLGSLVVRLGPNYVVLAPAYRLATVPENTFPAGLQDVFSAYKHLLMEGYGAGDICFAGTSSGGNTVLILAYFLAQAGLPVLAKLVTLAPAIDATCEFGPAGRAVEAVDLLSLSAYTSSVAQWLGNTGRWNARDPLVSAAYIREIPTHLPRILVLCGSADQLVGVVRELAQKLQKGGAQVKYEEVEDMPHAFGALPFFSAQREDVWLRVVEFIQGNLVQHVN